MTRRTSECYLDVFNLIESKLFKLEPTELMTDFEGGLRKAIEQKYPTARLRGCWYHFCAALRRNAIRLGLFALMKEDADARFIMKSLMCLPLLPEDRILEGFALIKKLASKNNLGSKFKQYFAYFESYWLVQVNNYHISILLTKRIKNDLKKKEW